MTLGKFLTLYPLDPSSVPKTPLLSRAAVLTPRSAPTHWCPLSSLLPHPVSLPNRHWLSSAYTQFAVPYFIYDIYAMFLCHWHKHQVKGHGGDDGAARAPGSMWAIARGYLHKEFLMVLHHAAMVLVCFPLSVVSPGELGGRGAGGLLLGPAGAGRSLGSPGSAY